MPVLTVDTAVAVQLATRDGRLHQLRVHVPALLAGSSMEAASSPMAAQRVGADSAPLLGLQGLSVSMSSTGTHRRRINSCFGKSIFQSTRPATCLRAQTCNPVNPSTAWGCDIGRIADLTRSDRHR